MVDIAGIGSPSTSPREPTSMETETEGVGISVSMAEEGEVVMSMPMAEVGEVVISMQMADVVTAMSMAMAKVGRSFLQD